MGVCKIFQRQVWPLGQDEIPSTLHLATKYQLAWVSPWLEKWSMRQEVPGVRHRHRAKTSGSWKVRVLQRFARKHRFPSSPGSLCDRFNHGQQARLRSGKALAGWVPTGHDLHHFSQARLRSHSQDQGGNFCTCTSLRHTLSNKISLKKPWSPFSECRPAQVNTAPLRPQPKRWGCRCLGKAPGMLCALIATLPFHIF